MDHKTGFVDAMLRLMPPAVASQDYRDGYRAGVRHRMKDAQDTLTRLGVDMPRIYVTRYAAEDQT